MTTFTFLADEVLVVSGSVVNSSASITVPAGSYKFSFVGLISRSTANGGALTIGCSTATVAAFAGVATQQSGSSMFLNDSKTVAAGTHCDIVYDAATTATQMEQATGTLTCANETTFNLSVYCAANQSVTIGKGATFSLN